MNQPIFNFQFFSRSILLVLITMLFIKCGTDKADNLSKSKIEELKKINPEDLTFDQAYALTLSQWPVDFEQLEIPTRYGKAGILAAGPKEAEPLVLLHGMNASSSMWYPNIEALSKNHRVYAIDFLLEPGKSEKLNDINNTNDIVDWYYEIFDQLKLEKFSIIGASRGGWLRLPHPARADPR